MGIKTAATEQNDRMDGVFEPRLEDYRLLTGAGNFQDDEAAAGAAWGVFVRSPHAFADIRGIDTASAQAVPGVLADALGVMAERAVPEIRGDRLRQVDYVDSHQQSLSATRGSTPIGEVS